MTNQNPEIPVPTFEMYKDYIEKSKKCKSVEELLAKDGPLNFMFKDMVQALLNVEMTEHLGYERSDARSKKTDNSRNGSYTKKLKTDNGEIQIEIPRDRDGKFEPKIIPKFKTKTTDLERKIISMYAKGMTTSDISDHISDLYLGSDVSATFISQVTDKVLPLAREWQARALDKVYPVVFFDAIHYKVREDGKIVSKAVYVAMAINLEGKRDILGFYIGDAESSKFWLQVFSDLNNRGIQDILIACVDGLKGLPDAIKTIFPKTEIQLCIVHQIRNSFKYVGSTNQKEFAKDLKLIYTAHSEDHAKLELNNLKNKWGEKYPIVIRSWENNWINLTTFFQYTAPIRKMIYTTNIIEGYNRQLRKVTKNRGVFPTDDSLFKLLYLATTDASKKWNMPRHGWAEMIGQLAIHFDGRVPLEF